MSQSVTHVAILGSTGSVGCSTLEVIAASGGRLRPWAISAHTRLELAVEQARRHQVPYLVATDPRRAESYSGWSRLPASTQRIVGMEGLEQLVRSEVVDVVVAAIVGSAGLRGTWAAVDAGKRVALANKETLVMAGPQVMERARRCGAELLPVDSEHSAVFQAMAAGRREEIRRVVLTASGGPFLRTPVERLDEATVQQALQHPTWDMGPKITIDSATMMNKALEVIEARWLFDLPAEKIDVVIHPQSIVHSLVEFIDGSVLAQLSPPDMRLPIQYALSYPERWPGVARTMDFSSVWDLHFEPPDPQRFPALELGEQVARAGGTAGAVLNAANEAAVALFLAEKLPFTQIVPACRAVVEHHTFDASPTLDDLLRLDRWARQEVDRWAQS